MEKKGSTILEYGRRSDQGSEKSALLCPQCRRNTTWQDNPYRPFCSARCRSIDLGAWVEEEYRVPGENAGNSDNDEERNE